MTSKERGRRLAEVEAAEGLHGDGGDEEAAAVRAVVEHLDAHHDRLLERYPAARAAMAVFRNKFGPVTPRRDLAYVEGALRVLRRHVPRDALEDHDYTLPPLRPGAAELTGYRVDAAEIAAGDHLPEMEHGDGPGPDWMMLYNAHRPVVQRNVDVLATELRDGHGEEELADRLLVYVRLATGELAVGDVPEEVLQYWPGDTPEERRAVLVEEMGRVAEERTRVEVERASWATPIRHEGEDDDVT